MNDVGVVIIGRNEGDRFKRCLDSLVGRASRLVYVDSGSTDDSVALARAAGVDVVELDLSLPFTAARARNAGWRRLVDRWPDTAMVQFVDGDCQAADGWLEQAADTLRKHPEVAVVCGRRREQHPEASIYNALCDLEWNTPVGEAAACGGDAMMRLTPVRDVGGFNDAIIAGEEPELCLRLRRQGAKVWRIDADMTLHDAAMTRFGQWWRRNVRAGHAYAEGAALHGRGPERFNVAAVRSILGWTLLPPLVTVAAVVLAGPWALLLLAVYPVQVMRLGHIRHHRHGTPKGLSLAYGLFIVMGKFAEFMGVLQYHVNRFRGRRTRLIEYKAPQSPRPNHAQS